MNYEDVQKLSNAAEGKAKLLENDFYKYFLRAVMAGFFIDIAMIFSNVVGSIFSSTMPEWGKFLSGIVFSYCSPFDLPGRRRAVYREQSCNGFWCI